MASLKRRLRQSDAMPAQHQKAISPDFVPITDSRLLEERLKVATDVEGLVPLYVACEQKLAPDRLWSQIDFTLEASPNCLLFSESTIRFISRTVEVHTDGTMTPIAKAHKVELPGTEGQPAHEVLEGIVVTVPPLVHRTIFKEATYSVGDVALPGQTQHYNISQYIQYLLRTENATPRALDLQPSGEFVSRVREIEKDLSYAILDTPGQFGSILPWEENAGLAQRFDMSDGKSGLETIEPLSIVDGCNSDSCLPPGVKSRLSFFLASPSQTLTATQQNRHFTTQFLVAELCLVYMKPNHAALIQLENRLARGVISSYVHHHMTQLDFSKDRKELEVMIGEYGKALPERFHVCLMRTEALVGNLAKNFLEMPLLGLSRVRLRGPDGNTFLERSVYWASDTQRSLKSIWALFRFGQDTPSMQSNRSGLTLREFETGYGLISWDLSRGGANRPALSAEQSGPVFLTLEFHKRIKEAISIVMQTERRCFVRIQKSGKDSSAPPTVSYQ